MVKLVMEHFEGDKWNPSSHYIEYGDFSTKNPVQGFSIEESARSTEDNPLFNYTIGFEAGKGGSTPTDRKQLVDQVTNLLNGAGIEDFKIEGSSHDRTFSVEIKGVKAGELTRVAGALSTNVDLGQGTTEYALIDKDVAVRAVDLEAEATGLDVDAYSLDKIELNSGNEYMSYESNIAGSTIQALQQDGQQAGFDIDGVGHNVTLEKTNVVFRDGVTSAVSTTFMNAGLIFERANGMLRVNSPIADVAQVLSQQNLIPQSANAAIQKEFATLRPDFHYVASRDGAAPVLKRETVYEPV